MPATITPKNRSAANSKSGVNTDVIVMRAAFLGAGMGLVPRRDYALHPTMNV